jgi:hypothetical protein
VIVSVALLLVVMFGAPPVVAGLLLLAWGVVWAIWLFVPGGSAVAGCKGDSGTRVTACSSPPGFGESVSPRS